MNYKEYAFTASEITQLEYILSIMPPDRVVERIGLETTTTGLRWRLHPAFAAGGAASLVGTASPFVA